MLSLTKSQVPFYNVILAIFSGVIIGIVYHHYVGNEKEPTPEPAAVQQQTSVLDENCNFSSTRIKRFDLTQPLLFAEEGCESSTFATLHASLDQQISSLKLSGEIGNASIYLREFRHGKWMELNGEESYHPASLIKVPIMMAILKMTETNPGLLEKEFVFDNIPKELIRARQNYFSDTIVRNQKYTVRKLLEYMVANSDNNAQHLLVKNLNPTGFDQMFEDLGLGMPMDNSGKEIMVTAKAYSAFFKALFNATYLDASKSEFALSLMEKSTFKDGFMKSLPPNTKIVHKFGEWDNKTSFELHESGLIYLENKVYLLTIMTKGDGREKLPGVISSLTKTVYDFLEQRT